MSEPGKPPAFFRRTWQPPMSEPLTIYGRHSPSTFPDDAPREREAWAHNRGFLAECFSVVEPDGEYGMVSAQVVTEITEAEFEQARTRGWQA